MLQKLHSLFCHELQLITILILICDSYMIWSKVIHISLCGIPHFWFRPVFKFIFLFNKIYGLRDFMEASTKKCETVKKYKSMMKILFHTILNKVLTLHSWKLIKWWFNYIKSINGLSNRKWTLTQTQANKPKKIFLVEKPRRFLILHYVEITALSWKPISKTPR